MKLSFTSCYYIRKILLQHSKDLQWILEQKNGFCLNTLEDLKGLLDSVYLEDILEQLLQRLYGEGNEVDVKIQQLESLCLAHQRLVAQNLAHSEEMLSIQQQLFWLLGFKRIEINFEEIVNALNQLSKYSSNYLGATLTTNNWQSNRPNTDWLDNFSIDRSAKFAFSGTSTEAEDFGQLQWLYKWVTAFVQQYAKTFRDFPDTIEQKKLGEVKKGLLLTRLGTYSAWLNVETPVHSWAK
jgi:hypothetical protein